METDSPDVIADNKTTERGFKKNIFSDWTSEKNSFSYSAFCVELTEQIFDSDVAITYCHINLKMIGSLPKSPLSSRRINILSELEI